MPARRPTGLLHASLFAAVLVVWAAATAAPRSPADAPPRALCSRIEPLDAPSILARGEVTTAILDVRNTGTETWPAHGLVRLSYH